MASNGCIPICVPDRWPTTAHHDLAAYDRLPAKLRALLRNAPIQLSAEGVLADWQRWRRNGGDLAGFVACIRNEINQITARERVRVEAGLRSGENRRGRGSPSDACRQTPRREG